jgi:magnesium-transporting ATPase (P-type)
MVILQAVGQMSVILALSGVFAEEINYFEKGSL